VLSPLQFDSLIAKQGRSVELTRPGGATVTIIAQVKRQRSAPKTQELTQAVAEDILMVICRHRELAEAGWGDVIDQNDRMRIDGVLHRVRTDYPLYISDTLVGHRSECEG